MRGHLPALALLLYWQVGPLPHLERTDSGKTRWSLSVMGGTGQWEDPSFNCDGDLIRSQPVVLHDVGAKLELERGELRVSAAGSSVSGGVSSSAPSAPIGVLGGQVAFEGTKLGFGAGAARNWWSESSNGTVGSFYLRIGRGTKAHMRLDVNPIAETPGLTGPFRIGIGFRSGFVGFAWDPYGVIENTNVLADLAVPISRSVDLRLAGRVGAGYRMKQYGAGAGIRIHAPKR